MWIATLVIALAAGALAVREQLHMFQLNSYRWDTHGPWLAKRQSAWVPPLVALALAVGSLGFPLVCGIALLVWLAVTAPLNRPRPAKKPLVHTARVIRILATTTLGFALVVLATLLLPPPWRGLLSSLAYVLSPLWVLLANTLNAPIEAAIRRRYLREAKQLLASHPRLIKIGITGSYGKTSVKFYLATLLKGHFNVLMTPESYNTPMGITKTIRAELRATHEVFVCEMGAERRGEIREDCELVQPTIGIITAIGEQHLATFGSQEAILATKLELAEAVKGKGRLYLNGDDRLLRANQPDQERSLYGLGTGNDSYAEAIAVSTAGTRFDLIHNGQRIAALQTPLIGAHNIQNLAVAAAVALDLGVGEDELRRQLKKLRPAPHRLALSRQGSLTIIDDAYNSNPAGSKAALDTLCLFEGLKILITPGMVQLGEREEALNEAFGVQAAVCDHVFLVGAKQTAPIARGLAKAGFDPAKLTIVEDVAQAIAQAQVLPASGERVILLENDLPDNY